MMEIKFIAKRLGVSCLEYISLSAFFVLGVDELNTIFLCITN